jgi:hypothetical protein
LENVQKTQASKQAYLKTTSQSSFEITDKMEKKKKKKHSEGYEKLPSLHFTLTSKLNSLQNQCDVQTLHVQAFRNNSSSSVEKRGTESRAAMFRLAVLLFFAAPAPVDDRCSYHRRPRCDFVFIRRRRFRLSRSILLYL